MAAIRFAENYYSFRKFDTVFTGLNQPKTAAEQALAAIEAKLVEANQLFRSRRYQDAVAAYKQAQALIYAQLEPGFEIGHYATFPFPMSPALFEPLLSLGVEYMNVLPLPVPGTTIRPRVPVNPAELGKAVEYEKVGLTAQNFTTPSARDTVADFQLAGQLKQEGNLKASQFFFDRAKATDGNIFQLLDKAAPPPAAPTPAPVVSAPGAAPHALAAAQAVVATPTAAALRSTNMLMAAAVARVQLPDAAVADRSVGVMLADKAVTFTWKAGEAPPLQQIKTQLYGQRIHETDLSILNRRAVQPSDLAINLAHDYYYVVPLGLAECYHALGDWTNAETQYFQAAAYQFLNADVEAPYLFQRLATLYLDWGNQLFRNGQPADALPVYSRVVMPNGSVPTTALYSTAALAPGANTAMLVIPKLGDVNAINALNVNPTLAAAILEVWQQLTKIAGGLDFWGFWAPSVPIFTFDYLQSVAINFTQLAMNAERDYINYQDRADQGILTQEQLTQNATQSQAEVQVASLQAAAAATEVQAYQDGLDLANQRASDARANANEYAAKSWGAIAYQASSQQVSGGDDGDPGQLNAYASQLLGGFGISGSRATIAAATQLAGARLNREYEIDSMNRQAAELDTAAVQAQSEVNAAKARAAAANAAVGVAQLRALAAQQLVSTFNNMTFTPDVWHQMGVAMKKLYKRYLDMALRTARIMQQAYNFEMDQSIHFIKSDYSLDEVKGMLAAEALMADIQSFTFQLITSQNNKPQPLKVIVSLADRYPFPFENGLRKTGVMEFQTRIEDFDMYYPGTFAGRIEAVEVEVDGIVPVRGISGTLTNSGVSFYRVPASASLKTRVQSKETLVLSDYSVRQDSLEITTDQRLMRIFQGAGVASTWRLELPKGINDIDYGALTDVRLTFYYKARYDPGLHSIVVASLGAQPNFNKRQRGIPVRWLYPDAFFFFQNTGQLTLTLQASDFRNNESQPALNNVGILIATDGSVPAGNIKVSLATPAHAAIAGVTDNTGSISTGTGSAWNPLATGSALGTYTLTLQAADNPQFVKNGQLVLSPILNVVLFTEYTFVPRA
jgi:hypothetical protein